MSIYIIKDFLTLILNLTLILFINNIRAIENNTFNKNNIPNLIIKKKEEINKKKEEKLKKEKEKNKNILKKALLENKIIKIKKLTIIIFIYIYYNILILGLFNAIKV